MKIAFSLLVAIVLNLSPVSADAAPPASTEFIARQHLQGGLAVHLPVSDGALELALAEGGNTLVHGLAIDVESAEKARAAIRQAGWYGLISVEPHSDTRRLPYADHLVNLLVVDADALKDRAPTDAEIQRALAPAPHGVAYVKRNAQWQTLIKPMPTGFDDWPQYNYGPGCNAANGDTQVGPATMLQFVAGRGWELGKGSSSGWRITAGRAFHTTSPHRNDSYPRELIARDAFNGLPLWRREIEDGGRDTPYIATSDRLYAVLAEGEPLVGLNAATGEAAVRFDKGPRFETRQRRGMPVWATLAGDVLLTGSDGGLVALDATSGERRWAFQPAGKNGATFPVADVAGKRAFCVIVENQPTLSRWPAIQDADSIVALDLETGKQLWKNTDVKGLGLGELCFHDGLVGYFEPHGIGVTGRAKDEDQQAVGAIDAASGKQLWQAHHTFGAKALLFRNGGLWATEARQLQGWDAKTGKPITHWTADFHSNCNRVRASANYWILSAVTYADDQLNWTRQWITRSVCAAGGFPAYGMTYFVPNGCSCFYQVRGYLALNSRPLPEPDPLADRLKVTGAAPTFTTATNDADWTTYAASAQRTSSNRATISPDAKVQWSAQVVTAQLPPSAITADWHIDDEPLANLSQPVSAWGLVMVALPQEHRVVAYDVASGKLAWEFTAGGRVDSPPTLHRGRAHFGSRDGHVYALDAKTGKLLWRFQAAPNNLRMIDHGQLESQWPVHGSVLVHDDTLWCAAGRHPELGGGVRIFQLDPASGKVLRQHIAGPHEPYVGEKAPDFHWENGERGRVEEMSGSKTFGPGMLAADGRYLYTGSLVIDPKQDRIVLAHGGRVVAQLPGGKTAKQGAAWVRWNDESAEEQPKEDLPRVNRIYPRHLSAPPTRGAWNEYTGDMDMLTFTRAQHLARDDSGVYAYDSQRFNEKGPSLARWPLDGLKTAWTTEVNENAKGTLTHDVLKTKDHVIVAYSIASERYGPQDRGFVQINEATSGKRLAVVELGNSVPIEDGLAASGDQLLVATREGKLFCISK